MKAISVTEQADIEHAMAEARVPVVDFPPNAFKAILAEESIGLMLPCNVIVYEKGTTTVLSVIRPTTVMQIVDNVDIQKVAEDVETQLKKVFDAIS